MHDQPKSKVKELSRGGHGVHAFATAALVQRVANIECELAALREEVRNSSIVLNAIFNALPTQQVSSLTLEHNGLVAIRVKHAAMPAWARICEGKDLPTTPKLFTGADETVWFFRKPTPEFFVNTELSAGIQIVCAGTFPVPSEPVSAKTLWAAKPSTAAELPPWLNPTSVPWQSKLQHRYAKSRPVANAFNIATALHAEFNRALEFDELSGRYLWTRKPPLIARSNLVPKQGSVYCLEHVEYMHAWFLEAANMSTEPHDQISKVLYALATKRKNPLHELLRALPKWDGEPRLNTWLIRLCGAPDKSSTAATWLKQLVRRAIEPGCPTEFTLLLHGPCSMTEFLSALVHDKSLFAKLDNEDKPGNQFFIRQPQSTLCIGKWLAEAPDDSYAFGYVKRTGLRHRQPVWLTAAYDTAKPSNPGISRGKTKVPRVFVPCLTLNTSTRTDCDFILKRMENVPGLRIIRIEHCDVEALRNEREQLLAEALAHEQL